VKGRILVLAGIAALVALFVVWFRANYERVPAKEWVGASGEARLRHFLAAERLAQRMGWNARELRSLPELDALPAGGVLLVPGRRQALDAGRMAEILRWVERGGHLIAEAELLGVPDPLLDLLGVARARANPTGKPLRIEIPWTGRMLSASLYDGMVLDASAKDIRLLAGLPQAARLASFGHGRGAVSVATSLQFARNRAIGSEDHAELLWHLLSLTPGRELLVYFRPERLSLWGFLTEHALAALAATALVLALWLWSIMPRFGPVAPDAPPGRRRLLDHLRASGRYYWVKGLRARLVVAARDAALRRIARTQPDFATATQAERAARLASLIGASKEEAHRFITAAGPMRGAEFIKLAQHAQRVHAALEKGNK